jgi:hypothetical protein
MGGRDHDGWDPEDGLNGVEDVGGCLPMVCLTESVLPEFAFVLPAGWVFYIQSRATARFGPVQTGDLFVWVGREGGRYVPEVPGVLKMHDTNHSGIAIYTCETCMDSTHTRQASWLNGS